MADRFPVLWDGLASGYPHNWAELWPRIRRPHLLYILFSFFLYAFALTAAAPVIPQVTCRNVISN